MADEAIASNTGSGNEGQGHADSLAIKSALQNPMLLSRILGFLRLHSLKSARLVSPLWNQLSHPYVLQRSIVKFCSSAPNLCNLNGTPYSDYVRLYPEYKHEHVSIQMSEDNFRSPQEVRDIEFVSIITSLLIEAGLRIKTLRYWENEIWFSTSQLTSCFLYNLLTLVPNLVELDLTIDHLSHSLLNPIVLSSVTKLTLIIMYSDPQTTERLCQNLIRLTPNVQSLKLSGKSGKYGKTSFLNELISSHGFPNLHTLKESWSSKEVLILWLELPNRLREIDFGFVRGRGVTRVQQEILEEHKDTLEKVRFKFKSRTNKPTILLPDMPKLCSLHFTYRIITGIVEGNPSLPRTDFKALLESGPIAFKSKFPSLVSLRVGVRNCDREEMGNGTFYQEAYNPFFPDGDDWEFLQISELTIGHPKFTGRELSQENLEGTLRLAKMFPNVHKYPFNKARSKSASEV